MSYTQLLYHIVLRTHKSERTIFEAHERDLYKYILGFNNNHQVVTIRIGGMPDHVHLLVGLPATLPVAKYVQELKISTSKWMKANPAFPAFAGWTREYGAFTLSLQDKERIADYIRRQKEHHKVRPMADELRELLAEAGIAYDEKYFLAD